MYNWQIFEILEAACKEPSEDMVIATLRKNDSPTLRLILNHAFDPNIVYKLPSGPPPFKPLQVPVGYAGTTLFTENRRNSYLWHNPPATLSKIRLETLFTELLEILHINDANIMLAVKDKTLTSLYPKITYEVVLKAFPGLLPALPAAPKVPIDPVVQPKTTKPKKAKSTSTKVKKKKVATKKANGESQNLTPAE